MKKTYMDVVRGGMAVRKRIKIWLIGFMSNLTYTHTANIQTEHIA